MRKSAWIALGAGAAAIIALAVIGRPSGAQQPAAPPSVVLTAVGFGVLQGPAPAGLFPPRHPRRPVPDHLPVLPLLRRGRCRAGHSVDADLHGLSPHRGRQRQRQRPADRSWCGRRGPRRSRSSGSACIRSRVTSTSRIPSTSRRMGPNACATCHGDVTRMPQVYKVNNINNMGWCINCHLARDVQSRLHGVSLLASRLLGV